MTQISATFRIDFTQDQAPSEPADVLDLLRESGYRASIVPDDPDCVAAALA